MKPAIALAALILAVTPALAQQPTARVSGGDIAVRTGPGHGYRTIGRIPDGTQVSLDYCTRDDGGAFSGNGFPGRDRGPVKWCFVTDTGWVDATYLVGSAAKLRVTPFEFLVNPFEDDEDDFWN